MTYCEKLEQFRQELMTEFSRQFPTKHDFLDLFDKDDEDRRDDLPQVQLIQDGYSYSLEYVVRVENKEGVVLAVCEGSETGNWNSYDLSEFTTSELCEILDAVIQKVIDNKK